MTPGGDGVCGGLWIALAVLLALGLVIWRLRLGLYVGLRRRAGGGGPDRIGPFRIHLAPSKTRKEPPQETKKPGKPKREPKDLTEAGKSVPKPTLADLRDAAGDAVARL